MLEVTNNNMKLLGFIMAVVCDHPSHNDIPNPEHEVPLAFCLAANTNLDILIVTREMAKLIYRGYSVIATVWFDPSMPELFHVFKPRALPACAQSALLKRSEGLVNGAFKRGSN